MARSNETVGLQNPTQPEPYRGNPDAEICSRSEPTSVQQTPHRAQHQVNQLDRPQTPEPARLRKKSPQLADRSLSADASSERTLRAKQRPGEHVQIPLCMLYKNRRILSRQGSVSGAIEDWEARIESEAVRELDPPVTVAKLKELSLPSIQNNLPLRNDLCYDPELFFQRISGSKGEEKIIKARIAYACVSIELQTYAHNLQGSCDKCEELSDSELETDHATTHLPQRLEHWLICIRDLVAMLVPDTEKEKVKNDIDAEGIATTVRIGQSEVAKLSGWLANLLMSHCAPIRDDLCKRMHVQISDAAESRDMDLMVDGLENLFNLLENMKLDVANHQIRTFKTLLITDTVPFLQDCFGKMIAKKEMTVGQAKVWYDRIEQPRSEVPLDSGLSRLLTGILKLCTSSHEYFPTTFRYDKDRLINIRTDIIDLVELTVCGRTYCFELNRHAYVKPVDLGPALFSFRKNVMSLIHNDDGINEGIPRHLEDIGLEMASSIRRKAASSPQNPPVKFPADPDHMYAELDRRLRDKGDTDWYTETMQDIKTSITRMAYEHALRFSRMDTLQISNEQRNWNVKRTSDNFPVAPSMEDIARRLAHVAVVHWQTWAGLAYLKD